MHVCIIGQIIVHDTNILFTRIHLHKELTHVVVVFYSKDEERCD